MTTEIKVKCDKCKKEILADDIAYKIMSQPFHPFVSRTPVYKIEYDFCSFSCMFDWIITASKGGK